MSRRKRRTAAQRGGRRVGGRAPSSPRRRRRRRVNVRPRRHGRMPMNAINPSSSIGRARARRRARPRSLAHDVDEETALPAAARREHFARLLPIARVACLALEHDAGADASRAAPSSPAAARGLLVARLPGVRRLRPRARVRRVRAREPRSTRSGGGALRSFCEASHTRLRRRAIEIRVAACTVSAGRAGTAVSDDDARRRGSCADRPLRALAESGRSARLACRDRFRAFAARGAVGAAVARRKGHHADRALALRAIPAIRSFGEPAWPRIAFGRERSIDRRLAWKGFDRRCARGRLRARPTGARRGASRIADVLPMFLVSRDERICRQAACERASVPCTLVGARVARRSIRARRPASGTGSGEKETKDDDAAGRSCGRHAPRIAGDVPRRTAGFAAPKRHGVNRSARPRVIPRPRWAAERPRRTAVPAGRSRAFGDVERLSW
jgi:hypothetical protein